MTAVLYTHDAILIYTLAVMALLSAILLICIFYHNAHNWKISRITIRKCQSCHLVFADSRFSKNHRISCPRCHGDTKVIQAQDS